MIFLTLFFVATVQVTYYDVTNFIDSVGLDVCFYINTLIFFNLI